MTTIKANPADDALDLIGRRIIEHSHNPKTVVVITPIVENDLLRRRMVTTNGCNVIREQDENVCSTCGHRWDIKEEKPECN